MGGDHKCQVCQATFTRPQHVARHMRSHTGDRPYKCQYCGDQFARSDLLSRHVNKCHANEKPLPNTGARRKGSASASRATTSKQACDQCVQLSLPCDGCNPCAKCVSRKCRCTFVKFHRQTAPAGPGHSTRPPTASGAPTSSTGALMASSAGLGDSMPMLSSSTTSSAASALGALGLGRGYDDDLFLGPPPPSSAAGPSSSASHAHAHGQPQMQTMAESLYHSNSFAFPALYPSSSSSTSTTAAAAGVAAPTAASASELDAYAAKYRAQQAELYGAGGGGGRTGMTPSAEMYDPRAGWLGSWDAPPPPPASSSSQEGSSEYGAPPSSVVVHQAQQQQMQRLRQQQQQMQQQQQQHHHHHQQQQQQMRRGGGGGGGGDMHLNNDKAHPSTNPNLMNMSLSYPILPSASVTSSLPPHPSASSGQQQQQPSSSSGLPSSSSPSIPVSLTGQGPAAMSLAPSTSSNASSTYANLYALPRSQSRPGTASSAGSGGGGRGSVERDIGGAGAGAGPYDFEGFGVGMHGVPSHHHAHGHPHHGHGQIGHPYQRAEGYRAAEGGGYGHGHGGHGQQQGHGDFRYRGDAGGGYEGYEDETTAFRLGNIPDRNSTSSANSSSSSHGHRGYDDGPGSEAYAAHNDDRQADVHSAFGLMSLDDPNVIAGIAVDGQPFFSDPAAAHNQDAMSMDTPMPLKRPHSGLLQFPSALDSGEGGSAGASSMTSAAREADSRELREVWKQYMRTPLSGPTLDFGAPNMSPSRGGAQLGGNGSGGSGRRPRVASLPSSKTPVVERDHLYNHMAGGPGQMNGQEGAGGKAGTMSSLRTTLHGNEEDLRSYEAAVLARNPPTHLNLQVRRPAKGRGGGTGTSARPASAHETSGATIAHSASTSSLLNAFGNGGQQMGSAPPGRVSFVDIGKKEDSASPVPLSSRASSVSVDADGNNLSSDAESSRPSFKRLPSQTLGPANAKRAFLGYGDDEERVSGWGVTTDTNNAVSSDAGGNTGSIQKSNPGAGLGISQTDRIVASLAERRKRRMSAPSTNYIAPESNQTRRSQNQDQKQSQQGQGQTQGQSHQQKKEEIIPSVGYAPSGAQ